MPPETSPTLEHTCAVIITYRPDAAIGSRVARIAPQVARVWVVDNGSPAAERSRLERLSAAGSNVKVILSDTNEGIATALNHGFAHAIREGFRWVITFDQDSLVEPTIIEELRAVYLGHPEPDRIGVLAANSVDALGSPRATSDGSVSWREVTTAITSGSMISTDAYRRVGPFRDDYFMDLVDDEFCLRIRKHGLRIIVSTRPLMNHPLGKLERRPLPFGRGVLVTNHAAFRRYYMMRNRVLTLRAFGLREPAWALEKLRSTLYELLTVPLFETNRRRKLQAMLAGLRDGLLGRSGKTVSVSS